MDRLKILLSRLSDSLLGAMPASFRTVTAGPRMPLLRLIVRNERPGVASEQTVRRPVGATASHPDTIDDAIRRSQAALLSHQDPREGFWVAELEADTTLTSEYLMLRRFMGVVDLERERKAVRYLRSSQLPDGGWSIYHGGPAEISASVKAYFALKLVGVPASEPYMQKARARIHAMGGVVASNVFTKITLALFGQYDWRGVPSMPPEIMLLPQRFYFSIYAISYWSRAVLIPLLIVFAKRPLHRIAPEQGIDELYVEPKETVNYRQVPPFRKDPQLLTWRNLFITLDSLLKWYDQRPVEWLRAMGIDRATKWTLERLTGTGGLGAIYPAMANSVVALSCLGHDASHPLVAKALKEIEDLEVYGTTLENGQRVETLHLQPCHSPIWDTALLMNALVEAGLPPEHPALTKAASWLLSKQTKTVGDWHISSPHAKPGGWYFQFENEYYPDVDDSAVVLMALSKISVGDETRQRLAMERGLRWVMAMQGSDGGWGAYDKDNNRMVFNYIPFADHRALLDPSTSDLTGRCLEMLGGLGYDMSHPAVPAALRFLKREQEANGSWYGRWGVNYIYGTWSVLAGLRAIGEDMAQPYVRRAVEWLESRQNPDGGWGESCLSYADEAYHGRGESTPSQTAWALLALLSAGEVDSFSVIRGMTYLIRHQAKDGTWEEVHHTGTGFPRVFYLRYHWYCQYFPLWALAMYRNYKARGQSRADEVQHQIRKSGRYRF